MTHTPQLDCNRPAMSELRQAAHVGSDQERAVVEEDAI